MNARDLITPPEEDWVSLIRPEWPERYCDGSPHRFVYEAITGTLICEFCAAPVPFGESRDLGNLWRYMASKLKGGGPGAELTHEYVEDARF